MLLRIMRAAASWFWGMAVQRREDQRRFEEQQKQHSDEIMRRATTF
jgi:hypothetical protein